MHADQYEQVDNAQDALGNSVPGEDIDQDGLGRSVHAGDDAQDGNKGEVWHVSFVEALISVEADLAHTAGPLFLDLLCLPH